jgi:hypothetical protein
MPRQNPGEAETKQNPDKNSSRNASIITQAETLAENRQRQERSQAETLVYPRQNPGAAQVKAHEIRQNPSQNK